MARKLLLCLLAAFAVILFAGCDNSNNGGVNQIVLHPNGGVGSIEPISFNVGEAVQIPYNEDEITREGYDFIIWNTKNDGTGKDYGRMGYLDEDERETINLYAQWYKHYDMGDLGPQGGRVFFSRIADLDEYFTEFPEWIYLEVAPSEYHIAGQWAITRVDIPGTKPDEGAGKVNTELIIEVHGEDCIAYQCKYPSVAGGEATDWYLPSRLELGYLFKNVFKHSGYATFELGLETPDSFLWSSTQGFISGDQYPTGHAAVFRFVDGQVYNQNNYQNKESSYFARPVRQF